MRTSLDIPDHLYRSLKARAAIQGKTVREVAVHLFRTWVEQAEGPPEPEVADSSDHRAAWIARWDALGRKMQRQSADPRSAVEILLDDRR